MDGDFFREIQCDFIREAGELLDKSETLFMSLEKSNSDKKEIFDSLKRLAHNFKGSGKAVGFDDLSKFCHAFENLLVALSAGQVQLNPDIIDLMLLVNDTLKSDLAKLLQDATTDCKHPEIMTLLDSAQQQAPSTIPASEPTPEPEQENQVVTTSPVSPVPAIASKSREPEAAKEAKPPVDEFIRIPLYKIDELLTTFGEQVIMLSALDFYKDDVIKHRDELTQSISALKKMTFDLQQATLNLRMVNLKTLFTKLERVVRDSAKATQKQIVCTVEGAEQELDKAILDQVSDPLVHMVRNAVDHGIENAADRISTGKSVEGRVSLRARSDGGAFIIEIEDDGKGMDPAKIRKKAIDDLRSNLDHQESRRAWAIR